ncbi:MAG: hypothetical protein KGZ68_08780 [Dechloromonas sp.]|nr:hypothetical protein [Dechloromonas sp.]
MTLYAITKSWIEHLTGAARRLSTGTRWWPAALFVAILPLAACSQEIADKPVNEHPRRVYFPNFVMDVPQGFYLEPFTTTSPLVGQGNLLFMTTWPEFGSTPAEQSLAIMREPDARQNRRMDVRIETILAARPMDRRAYFDYIVPRYVAAQNEVDYQAKMPPGLVRLDIVPGLEGMGRTEAFLAARYAKMDINALNNSDLEGDLFFMRAQDGHVERAIICTARVFGPPPDKWSKWRRPICSHRFYIDDLALRVEVHYIRRFVSDWREIEARITALVRDNVIQRMDPCQADEDPCHCAIRFQKEYTLFRRESDKSYPFDPNSYDPVRRCAPDWKPDESDTK